jgi:hypothetical protein
MLFYPPIEGKRISGSKESRDDDWNKSKTGSGLPQVRAVEALTSLEQKSQTTGNTRFKYRMLPKSSKNLKILTPDDLLFNIKEANPSWPTRRQPDPQYLFHMECSKTTGIYSPFFYPL